MTLDLHAAVVNQTLRIRRQMQLHFAICSHPANPHRVYTA